MPVDRSKITVLIRPFIPDGHPVILQVFNIGVPGYEPQQFINYRLQMHFLGSEQRESFGKVETHLISEYTLRPDTCPVMLHHPVLADMSEKIQILLHTI